MLIGKIRNSFAAGKSEAEIVREMLRRGYKLEYISALVSQAKGKGLTLKVVSVLLFIGFGAFLYAGLFASGGVKVEMENPLFASGSDGLRESVTVTGAVVSGSSVGFVGSVQRKVEITPEFISYILNELGVWELHANVLTGDLPTLGFVIDGDEFYSVVDSGIETYRGGSSEVDVIFYSSSGVIISALSSEDSRGVILKSFSDGESSLELVAGEAELFSKGYLNLYESLGFS